MAWAASRHRSIAESSQCDERRRVFVASTNAFATSVIWQKRRQKKNFLDTRALGKRFSFQVARRESLLRPNVFLALAVAPPQHRSAFSKALRYMRPIVPSRRSKQGLLIISVYSRLYSAAMEQGEMVKK